MDADKIHKTNPIPREKVGEGAKQGCDAGMTITSSGAVRFFNIRFVQSLGRSVCLAGADRAGVLQAERLRNSDYSA
jgi:hypothetical protein